MTAIDGAWAAEVSFASHGVRFRIRTNAPDVLPQVEARLPPGSLPDSSAGVDGLYSVWAAPIGSAGSHLLFEGAQRIAQSDRLDHLLSRLESALHFDVARYTRAHLFVHAGALEWRGRGLLIPGRSMTGKSELTAALVRAGASYYSDEYAVLDNDGRLHPYTKDLGLRRDDGSKARVRAQRPGGEPLRVGAVAVTRYVPGASWRPKALSAGQAMAALLDNTVLARVRPRAAMDILARAASGVTALEGDRGEADRVAVALLARLDDVGDRAGPAASR